MAASAVTRVFDIQETLEMILLELPQRDLRTNVNRVSRIWHATIKSSSQIREKLFLRTANTKSLKPCTIDDRYLDSWPCYPYKPRLNEAFAGPAVDELDYESQDDNPFEAWCLPIAVKELPTLAGRPSSYTDAFLTTPPCNTIYFRFDFEGIEFSRQGSFSLYAPDGLTHGMAIESVLKAWKGIKRPLRDKANECIGYISFKKEMHTAATEVAPEAA